MGAGGGPGEGRQDRPREGMEEGRGPRPITSDGGAGMRQDGVMARRTGRVQTLQNWTPSHGPLSH